MNNGNDPPARIPNLGFSDVSYLKVKFKLRCLRYSYMHKCQLFAMTLVIANNYIPD